MVEYVQMPKHKRSIPTRFVFDIKWDFSKGKAGAYTKHKARLVAMGYRQREYNKTTKTGSYDRNYISSPVLKSTSLKAMLGLAAILPNLSVQTFDVGTAFLAARL